MSQTDESQDLKSLSPADLIKLLERLESQEQAVSGQRRLLHSRIDNLNVRSGDTPEFASELLASLQREERFLSDHRLQLHQQITDVRVERSRRRAVAPPPLRSVE